VPADPYKLLDQSRVLCLAPWVHVHLSSLGDFTPCCEILDPQESNDGATLLSHWNGAAMASIRKAMLEGRSVAACAKCYEKEAAGLTSYRQHFNELYRAEGHRLLATQEDGALAADIQPVDLDIRFSNLCNFRCRSCWHGASSRWFADADALGQARGAQAIITAGADREKTLEQVKQRLPFLRSIYFAGGEPLLMEEHYILLEELARIGRTDIRLSYHTNLSELGLGDRRVTELWKAFSDVRVRVSADGMGKTGELIRKGMDWSAMERNIGLVRDACPKVYLSIAITVSVLNVFHIPAFYSHLHDELGFGQEDIFLNPLQTPAHYNVQCLPRFMKKAVELRLQSLAKSLRESEPAAQNAELGRRAGRAGLVDIVDYMNARDLRQHIPRFLDITDRLDALRGEDSFATIPELLPLRAAARWETWWPRGGVALISRALRRIARRR
jgi:hypothetical protein